MTRARPWLVWILLLGLVGTEAELLLLEHYDGPPQFIPLVLIAAALVALLWHARRPGARSMRVLIAIMWVFLLAGVAGVGFHFKGAAEFQLETDPAMDKWELVKRVMRTKAPPVLAPGVMLQLGLIGLVYALSEPTSERSERP